MSSRLSENELADLTALADGTLPAGRRAEVEARVAASPELQELVEQQRRAVLALRGLATDEAPPSLRNALDGARRPASRRAPRFALAGAAVVAIAVLAAVVSSGGPGAPTVADAARFAAQPVSGPPPQPIGTAKTRLGVSVEGLSFPDLAPSYGWRALGARSGHVHGRQATVVEYAKDGRRLAYVIVAGAVLLRPAEGSTQQRRGVRYQTLVLDGRLAVTWRRGGHTCVLLGAASRDELVKLASWPLTPTR